MAGGANTVRKIAIQITFIRFKSYYIPTHFSHNLVLQAGFLEYYGFRMTHSNTRLFLAVHLRSAVAR